MYTSLSEKWFWLLWNVRPTTHCCRRFLRYNPRQVFCRLPTHRRGAHRTFFPWSPIILKSKFWPNVPGPRYAPKGLSFCSNQINLIFQPTFEFRFRSIFPAVAPTVRIEGPQERFIQEGSVLALTCLVTHQRRRVPAHLLWFRGTQRLDYNSPRGGVSVQVRFFSNDSNI